MAPRTQPPTGSRIRHEDLLLYESLAICRGEKPETRRRLEFSGYDGAKRGGSTNHADLAAGARSLAGEGDGSPIENQCREETDFGLNEPWSRNEYGRWSLCGKLMHWRKHRSPATRKWLENFWSGLILLSTYPMDPRRNVVGMAGARSGKKGYHGVGWPEWLVALSRGVDDPELRRKSNGKREGPDAFWPEDYSTNLCAELRAEIEETAAPVWASYRVSGWAGVLLFFRYGTRVGYRIVRTDQYLAVVIEQNCNGNTPPTWAFVHWYATGRSEWFPDTDERIRQQFDHGAATITPRAIHAQSEFFGTFDRALPVANTAYDARTHPAGVTVQGLTPAPVPAPQPGPAPSALSARLRPLGGGKFLLLVQPSAGKSATVKKIWIDPNHPDEDRYVIEEAS